MNHKLLVQSLKGSKGQVLWAFFFSRMAMDINDVIEWTGLKRETCYQSLKGLESVELLGTQTVAHGRKVWLLGNEMLPMLSNITSRLGSGTLLLQESEKRTPGELDVVVDEISDSVSTITTITTTLKGQESEKRTPANKKSPLEKKLDEHQITGKKRREILAAAERDEQPITAEYVQAHIDHATQEGHWDHPVGMAINRILDGMEVPQDTRTSRSKYSFSFCPDCHSSPCECYEHDEDCDCIRCRGNKPTCVWHEKGKPFCGRLAKPGSSHWCEEHYQIGVETYGTGEIDDGDQP